MKKTFMVSMGLFFAFTVILPIGASAQTLTDRIESRRQQAQERATQYIENRCDRVAFNIDQRIERYNANHEKNRNAYLNIKTVVINLISRLDSLGKNVAEVQLLLVKLDELIVQAADQYTEFINQLNNSKVFACGNSEGQFRNMVGEANSTLSEFRNTVVEINTFIRNELRPAVQAVAQS